MNVHRWEPISIVPYKPFPGVYAVLNLDTEKSILFTGSMEECMKFSQEQQQKNKNVHKDQWSV